MSEIFPNAPLVEAIFEIRFSANLSIDCKKDQYHAKIKAAFPILFIPTKMPSPPIISYRMASKDDKKRVIFSINSFVFSCAKYEGFLKFKEDCDRFMMDFVQFFKIESLTRIGLRYINNIPILKKEGLIPLNRYLNFGYGLPNSIPENIEYINSEFITHCDDGKTRILIRNDIRDNDEVIVLDFDYFFEGELESKKISDYLKKSHKHTKQFFLDIITEEYKDIMRKES